MTTAVLLDIDGVLTTSWLPLPGAAETLAWLREASIPFRLVTNSSSKTRHEIARLLSDSGMPVEEAQILTAANSAAHYFKEHRLGPRCFVLNEGIIAQDLEGLFVSDAASADAVLLGGAGPSIGYPDFNAVFTLACAGTPVVALHRNLRYRTADGLALDMGAFIIGLERAAGIEIPIVGKPTAAFFEAAFNDLGVRAADAIVVGDDIEADVLGAQAVGATGILVKTGKFHPSDLVSSSRSPDHVIDDVGRLPRLLDDMGWD